MFGSDADAWTTRRRFVGVSAALAVSTASGCLRADATAAGGEPAADEEPDLTPTARTGNPAGVDRYLRIADGYDGDVADRRGRDAVTIAVGAPGNGGNLAFEPPAIHVDRGTTVRWEWTGEGGGHNVVSHGDGPLDSGRPASSSTASYEHTFETDGVFLYDCEPHHGAGMLGAVVVGTDYERATTRTPGPFGAVDDGARADPPVFGGYLTATNNFDGEVADRRGRDAVTVTVGAPGNGGNLAFEPPAIHVDRGTTVRWEWTGDGGAHDVVSPGDGPLDSGDPTVTPGVNYEHAFEADGVYRYRCGPHEPIGMRGGIVVGDDYAPVTATADPIPSRTPHPDLVAGTGDRTFDGWLDPVDDYRGIVDRTDESAVTVAVGAPGNGGHFAFDPPAVRVDAGTTIRWEWTGDGGAHDVTAPDGRLDSGEPVAEPGIHYEHAFAEPGIHRYTCRPHDAIGMRGVVEVV